MNITQAYMTAAWQRCQKMPNYERLFIEAPPMSSLKAAKEEARILHEKIQAQKKKEQYYKRLEHDGI